jgi:hypothetical protein
MRIWAAFLALVAAEPPFPVIESDSLPIDNDFGIQFGTDIDYCGQIKWRSQCALGMCVGLFWTDIEHTEFTFDKFSNLDGIRYQITCDEAESIIKNEISPKPQYHRFDSDLYAGWFHHNHNLLREIFDCLDRFPFEDERLLTAMGELYNSLYGTAELPIEAIAANTDLIFTMDFVSVSIRLTDLALGMSMVPVQEKNSATFKLIANFVQMMLDVHASGLVPVNISPFKALRDAFVFSPPDYRPHGEADGSRTFFARPPVVAAYDSTVAENMARSIDEIENEALSLRHARLTGTPFSLKSLSLDTFATTVRLMEYRFPGFDVVRNLFETRVCSNLGPIVEYLYTLAGLLNSMSPRFNHVVSTAVAACEGKLSAQTRIAISVMFRGWPVLPLDLQGRQDLLWLSSEKEKADEAVESYLKASAPFLDLVVLNEGCEHVGYPGQRKQWIDETVKRYFNPRSAMWKFTDERKVKISFNENFQVDYPRYLQLRAAGRVMGLALRYEVPMGVALADSFIHGLRNLHEPEISANELNALIRDEDPTFLAGIDWIADVNWTAPPPTVGWMSFEGLELGGENIPLTAENWERFVRKTKLKKLLWNTAHHMAAFRAGVTDIVGGGILGFLSLEELKKRIQPVQGGFQPELQWKGLDFRNFDPKKIQHAFLKEWLRQIIFELSEREIRRFSFFVTGVTEPPVTAETEPWIKVFFESALDRNSLPRSHTCHNELQLPLYGSRDVMRQRLVTAFMEADSINGYAGYPTEQVQPQAAPAQYI